MAGMESQITIDVAEHLHYCFVKEKRENPSQSSLPNYRIQSDYVPVTEPPHAVSRRFSSRTIKILDK